MLNTNVPHSCCSPNNGRAWYSTFLVRPDFLYGDFGSDVERNCFRPLLQNFALPCIRLTRIAELAGFSNASRFAAVFRRQFGCNPAEYNSFKKQN